MKHSKFVIQSGYLLQKNGRNLHGKSAEFLKTRHASIMHATTKFNGIETKFILLDSFICCRVHDVLTEVQWSIVTIYTGRNLNWTQFIYTRGYSLFSLDLVFVLTHPLLFLQNILNSSLSTFVIYHAFGQNSTSINQ